MTKENEIREKIIITAKYSPENQLLEQLKSSLEEYRLIRSKDNKEHLMFHLMLMLVKYSTEDQTITQALTEVNDLSKIMDMVKNVKLQ